MKNLSVRILRLIYANRSEGVLSPGVPTPRCRREKKFTPQPCVVDGVNFMRDMSHLEFMRPE